MADAIIKHAFQSQYADGSDTTKLQPSDWNANLLVTGGVDANVLTRDSTSATGASWSAASSVVTDATLALSDITTNNVSTSKHGFAPKAPGVTTSFLNGNGAYSTPVLSTDVSGVLPVANGGTGAATLTSNGVVIGNGTGAVTITAEGATGTFLSGVTGADPVFAIPPSGSTRCAAYNSIAQSINDGAFTLVTFDSEDYDVTAVHSTSSNTSRFTIPSGAGGTYHISAVISFAPNALGQRIIKVIRTGSDFSGNGYIMGSTGATYITGMSLSVETTAVAGDYFEIHAYQNSGGALNIGGNTSYTMNRMQISRIA